MDLERQKYIPAIAREAYEQSLFTEMAELIVVQAASLQQNDEQIADLETNVSTDDLTGLLRRTYFIDEVVSLYMNPKRVIDLERHHSLLVLDLDNFKNVNDVLGHSSGDECLKTAANLIDTSLLRDNDLACRWGGEEFVVFLPDTSLKDAEFVAKRIRSNINSYVPGESLGRMGVSIGITSCHPGYSFMDSFNLADKQTLQAKTIPGKNQILISDGLAY